MFKLQKIIQLLVLTSVSLAFLTYSQKFKNSVFFGNSTLTDELLNHGADPNIYSDTGISPVMASVLLKKLEDLKSLIHHSANLNIQENQYQRTPLMVGVFANDEVFVDILIKS